MKFGVLWVTTSDGAVRDYPLDLPNLLVGRADGNSIVIDDISVARRHARLAIDSGRLMVEDLGSAEGTYVTGQRIPPYTPSLVESGEEVRLGDVVLRYQAPAGQDIEQLLALPLAMPQADTEAEEAPAVEPVASVRAFFAAHPAPAQPGSTPGIATLTVQNRGQVVDELTITVAGVPEEWVRVANPRVLLLPGDSLDVAIVFAPPREPNSRAGDYELNVSVTSRETGREVLAPGQLTVLPFEELALSLHPVRSKKKFQLEAHNRGNAHAVYSLAGQDDEEVFRYQFAAPTLDLAPGELRRLEVRVRRPSPPPWPLLLAVLAVAGAIALAGLATISTSYRPSKDEVRVAMLTAAGALVLASIAGAISGRSFFGHLEINPFRLTAQPARGGTKTFADGQLYLKPPMQPFVLPAMLCAILGVLGFVGYAWYFGPPAWLPDGPGVFKKEVATASAATANDPEAAYAGIHMCDKAEKPRAVTVSKSAAPLFKQNDEAWAKDTYAKKDDDSFAKLGGCGTTLEQCGCGVTSVASIMSVFELLTMPDGKDLTPATMNAWFNALPGGQPAVKTDRGWVSEGYVYGDVLWTAVNQLSAEIQKARPGARAIRYKQTVDFNEAVLRDEVRKGRPVILELPGHYVAAINLDGDKVLINDPYYKDRKTIDSYKGKIKSMALFEVANDLSAVVITAPADMRIRVTDATSKKVVGTLDPAGKDPQKGIEGATYMTRAAWRDPTCVESAPPPEAGTVQVVLPGQRQDYVIEIVSSKGDRAPTAAAIHTYDQRGVMTLQLVGRPDGSASVPLKFDPQDPAPAPAPILPGPVTGAGAVASPTAAAPTTAPAPPPAPPAAGAVTPAASATAAPSATAAGSVTPAATATVPPTPAPTPTPPPNPPNAVVVACTVAYQQTPKLATITCNATIDGAFTNIAWSVNGIFVPTAQGVASFTTTFTADTTLTIGANACNFTACRPGTAAVAVNFPSATATPTPTGTPTGTPTPIAGTPVQNLVLVCGVPNGAGVTTCEVQFTGPFTSVTFTAPGANPGTQTQGIKTFTSTFPAEVTTQVTATVCNYTACATSPAANVEGGPLPTVAISGPTTGACGSITISVTVGGALGAAPGTATLFIDGAAIATQTLAGGAASYTPSSAELNNSRPHTVSWHYNGHATSRYRINDSSALTVNCT